MTSALRVPMHCSLVALVALAGCTHPVTYNAVTPTPQSTVYDCVKREMTRLSYEVSHPDPAAHFRVGDRASGQHGPTKMGNVVHERLTATVTSLDSASVKLSIVASTEKVITFLNSSGTQSMKPTDSVRADAVIVMHACARITR